jgi:peptidoglycan hydrolase-like protein with peptidoglycan-binding domain
VLGGIAALAVMIVVAAWLFLRGGGDDAPTTGDAGVATTTAQVEIRDLVETESVDGTLAYAGDRIVNYMGPGVVAKRNRYSKNGSGSSTNTAYHSNGSGAVAIAYWPETTTEPTPTGTTPTDTEPADTTPTEPEPEPTEPEPTEPEPTEPEPTEPEPEPTEPEPTAPSDSGSTPDDTGSQTPSGASIGSAPSSGGGSTQPTGGTDDGAASGAESATVTWLAHEGAVLGRGDVLFRANDRATLLLYGATPVWRTLRLGMKGEDVRQLERNLVAMGYGAKAITVDSRFGVATKRAVKQWQRDLGVDDTGVVKLGMVTFLPGKRRVESVEVALGDQIQVGQTVLTTSSTRQVVTVDLDAADQQLLAVGNAVTIELPDGSEIAGTVEGIGTVATSSDGDEGAQGNQAQQDGDTSSTATIPVTISLDEASGVELDEAPVDVEIASSSAEDVLAVPVTALLALLGGGYAVEVVDASGQTRLVRVEPGMFADGYVEIAGDGIEEGTTVVVPA